MDKCLLFYVKKSKEINFIFLKRQDIIKYKTQRLENAIMEIVAAHYKKVKKENRDKLRKLGKILRLNADHAYDFVMSNYAEEAMEKAHELSQEYLEEIKNEHR